MDLTSYLLGKKASGGGGGGGDLDWTAIGYSQRPQSINDDYAYAKQIYDNWDATQTNLYRKFISDLKLKYMPMVDTSKANDISEIFNGCVYLIELPLLDLSNASSLDRAFKSCALLKKIPNFNTPNIVSINQMCSGCSNLVDVPLLNTSNLNGNSAFQNAFDGCSKLTDESLDNILQMCINASKYNGTKTLARLGISSAYYTASKIQSLPHYQAFINAGWTIGY